MPNGQSKLQLLRTGGVIDPNAQFTPDEIDAIEKMTTEEVNVLIGLRRLGPPDPARPFVKPNIIV